MTAHAMQGDEQKCWIWHGCVYLEADSFSKLYDLLDQYLQGVEAAVPALPSSRKQAMRVAIYRYSICKLHWKIGQRYDLLRQ